MARTKWDLTLFYKNAKDPAIEADVMAIEQACKVFAAKYSQNVDHLATSTALRAAIEEYERLIELLDARPLDYFGLVRALNAGDVYAQAQSTKLGLRVSAAANQILFFELALGKVGSDKQTEFLRAPGLADFKYFLERVFAEAKHNLAEGEEKIMSLKSLPAQGMWVESTEKMLSRRAVRRGGRRLPLPAASGLLAGLPTSSRRRLWRGMVAEWQAVSEAAEAELNALCVDKKINDELRHYPEPYSSTLIRYQTDEATVLTLVREVTNAFAMSHRFYKLKKKLLKLPHLEYCDRAADIGKFRKRITFAEAQKLFTQSLSRLDIKYADIFARFLERGQIDVYPKQGKDGGAFCSHGVGANRPTMVMLNHTDDPRAFTTMAHEMGHAFHSELSKQHQRPIYRGYSIAVAEVASTLFENFAFDELFATLSERERVIALHNRLNDSVSTIFRQVACFNFELELHRRVRSEGFVPREEIAKLMNQHMAAYLGPAFRLAPGDGYFFVNWSHLRNFFYVYSYAYGELVSQALYRQYKQDPTFWNNIERFLTAGGSMSPADIWKMVSLNTADPTFWRSGLKQIDDDIATLEKLVEK